MKKCELSLEILNISWLGSCTINTTLPTRSCKAVVTTTIRLRYDHSTTYVTIVGLPVRGLLQCSL